LAAIPNLNQPKATLLDMDNQIPKKDQPSLPNKISSFNNIDGKIPDSGKLVPTNLPQKKFPSINIKDNLSSGRLNSTSTRFETNRLKIPGAADGGLKNKLSARAGQY